MDSNSQGSTFMPYKYSNKPSKNAMGIFVKSQIYSMKVELKWNTRSVLLSSNQLRYLVILCPTKEYGEKTKGWSNFEYTHPEKQDICMSGSLLSSNYRRFINVFAQISGPLHQLTCTNGMFKWDDKMDKSFEVLENNIRKPPILAYPSFHSPFIVATDTSGTTVAANVSQKCGDVKLHPVHDESRSLNASEKNFSEIKMESLSVLVALKIWLYWWLSEKFAICI